MGSSAKKKREKKKDFQKTKFKVGKAKPKASNFTDTSFKSKAIAMGKQSLSITAPDVIEKFKHSLNVASSSKSDKHRQEALAHLTGQLSSTPPINPVGTKVILDKLLPLISNNFTPVRKQLLKLFQALPAEQVRHCIEMSVLYVRLGMSHLSADVSGDSLDFMEWLLEAAGDDLCSTPGGWVKTLNTLCAMLAWHDTSAKQGWSSSGQGSGRAKDSQNRARAIAVLAHFISVALQPTEPLPPPPDPWEAFLDHLYRIPRDPSAYTHLNLTGPPRDEESEIYADRESRQRIFYKRFVGRISKGSEQAKKEGGLAGRNATFLEKVLDEGMGDYEPNGAVDYTDLLDLW